MYKEVYEKGILIYRAEVMRIYVLDGVEHVSNRIMGLI